MLAWMDLEMTGLDPTRHVIVEIATLITDDDLNVLAEGPDLVIHATDEQLALMDDVVVGMHTKSGLLEAVKASTTTLEEAGAQTLDFLKANVASRQVPLCGNSIGTDRRFLAVFLPDVESYLHYRSVDVSTVKELARRWYPEAAAEAPRKAGGHRALDDIRESVAELRHYRATIFTPPPPAEELVTSGSSDVVEVVPTGMSAAGAPPPDRPTPAGPASAGPASAGASAGPPGSEADPR